MSSLYTDGFDYSQWTTGDKINNVWDFFFPTANVVTNTAGEPIPDEFFSIVGGSSFVQGV